MTRAILRVMLLLGAGLLSCGFGIRGDYSLDGQLERVAPLASGWFGYPDYVKRVVVAPLEFRLEDNGMYREYEPGKSSADVTYVFYPMPQKEIPDPAWKLLLALPEVYIVQACTKPGRRDCYTYLGYLRPERLTLMALPDDTPAAKLPDELRKVLYKPQGEFKPPWEVRSADDLLTAAMAIHEGWPDMELMAGQMVPVTDVPLPRPRPEEAPR